MVNKVTIKPRNPYVAGIQFKTGAGIHQKSNKQKRKKQKQQLKKSINSDIYD